MSPIRFEEWLAREHGPGEIHNPPRKGRCQGCLREDTPIIAGDDCLGCLSYAWGYDQAVEEVGMAILTATVKASIGEDGAHQELVGQAVARGFREHADEFANSAVRLYARAS